MKSERLSIYLPHPDRTGFHRRYQSPPREALSTLWFRLPLLEVLQSPPFLLRPREAPHVPQFRLRPREAPVSPTKAFRRRCLLGVVRLHEQGTRTLSQYGVRAKIPCLPPCYTPGNKESTVKCSMCTLKGSVSLD
jgi:hypothetical protein